MRKILVVDDESNILELISYNLKQNGYLPITAHDGKEALRQFQSENPDLVLLDLMIPEPDGMEVCRKIREKSQVPIMIISARVEDFDKVLALELGADDYMTKPFSVREMMARIKALLRRIDTVYSEEKTGEQVLYGSWKLLCDQHRFLRGEKEITLTITEYRILEMMMRHPGRVFHREEMMRFVWGEEFYGDTRAVDVHIRHLREKLEDDPAEPQYIQTVRGVGYRMKEIDHEKDQS